MSKYEPRLSKDSSGDIYALVVRIDKDGSENVCHGFGKHYKTEKGALRGANKYIKKMFIL